jgi:hypothetical protein
MTSTATPASPVAAKKTTTKISKPVAKPVPAKSTPAAPSKAAASSKPLATSAAVKPVKAVKPNSPAPKVAKAVKTEKADKTEKAKKQKMIRDSFTIPKAEYVVLEDLKTRATKLQTNVKKTELIRAGIKALASISDTGFVAAIGAVPNLKTGRPAKD